MEHDAICCSKSAEFRLEKSVSIIEYCVVLVVLIRFLIDWIYAIYRYDLTVLLFLPVIVVSWFIWIEKDQHLYRDFSYTFFFVVMSELLLSVCTAVRSFISVKYLKSVASIFRLLL